MPSQMISQLNFIKICKITFLSQLNVIKQIYRCLLKMFSALSKIFWLLFTLLKLAFWILKLAWYLVLLLSFCYGLLNLVIFIHKLCKYISEQHHQSKSKTTKSYINVQRTLTTYQSFDESNSVCSGISNSSRRSSDGFVVTSWESIQVINVKQKS